MQPTSSHGSTPKPSGLFAVVCLAIASRLHPEWTAVTIADAAGQVGTHPERVCRLATRCKSAFEATLGSLTRIGRPPIDRADSRGASERALLSSLLEVASGILRQVSLRRAAFRNFIVGSFERLAALHPSLTLKRFAEFLGISERTLRNWRRRPTSKMDQALAGDRSAQAPPPRSSTSVPQGPGRVRRPRFGFDVTLPDTQYAGDTTDLAVFGVPLKMMAAQDIGGRDFDLLDAAVIDTRESAEQISQLLESVLSKGGGEQVHTDQGRPYMAWVVATALEDLKAEHAPQVEGDPCGKATIERAFRTVKDIARPIFAVTNRLAAAFPDLSLPELAKSAADLIVRFLLRAYQAGARAAWRSSAERGNIDLEALARASDESRERARVADESARLLLTRAHEALSIPGSVSAFIRRFRSFPIPVLQRAERAFATQAHRDDIANRSAYFSGLVFRFNDEHARIQQSERVREQEVRRRRQDRAQAETITDHRDRDPASWFFEGLEYLAYHWIPQLGQLLFDGIGAGTGNMQAALQRLIDLHGFQPAVDIARGVIQGFLLSPPSHVPREALPALASVAERLLVGLPTPVPTPAFTPRIPPDILRRTGSPPRPGPSPFLRT